MIADLTPEKDGVIVHNMEDDIIRGATAVHAGEITYPTSSSEGSSHSG